MFSYNKAFTAMWFAFLCQSAMVFAFGTGGLLHIHKDDPYGCTRGLSTLNDGRFYVIVESNCLAGAHDFTDSVTRFHSDGSVDTSFGVNGEVILKHGRGATSKFSSSLVDTKSGVIYFMSQDPTNHKITNIYRVLSNGQMDPLFGNQGVLKYEPENDLGAIQLLEQPSGELYLFTNTQQDNNPPHSLHDYRACLQRILPNGTFDGSFGPNGKMCAQQTEHLWAAIVRMQSDGKIVRGYIAEPNFRVGRYNADMTLDKSFGVKGIIEIPISRGFATAQITELKILPNGKIMFVGRKSHNGRGITGAVVRLTNRGRPDPKFGTGGLILENQLFNFITLPDQSFIVYDYHQFRRYSSSGKKDLTFGHQGTAELWPGLHFWNFAVQPDGKVLVGGATPSYPHHALVGRFTSSGQID